MKILVTAALLLTGGGLMAQTKSKPKFPNPKLRASVELGIVSAEANVHYNINRRSSFSLGAGYGYTIAGFRNKKSGNSNPGSKATDMSLFGDFRTWSSFMVNGSYRYYLRKRGNYLPNGGYLGVLLRYRGEQKHSLEKYKSDEMKPMYFYALQLGHVNYLSTNRLYTDFSFGYGLCVNKTYTDKAFAPQLSFVLGWFIGPNKIKEDRKKPQELYIIKAA